MFNFHLPTFKIKKNVKLKFVVLDLLAKEMTEKTATEASNDFWLEFKAERQGNALIENHYTCIHFLNFKHYYSHR